MDFITAMTETRTQNGGKAYQSTKSDLVDAFASLGSKGKASENEILRMYGNAWAENNELALKLAFYIRNVRGQGLGERKIFRTILKYLAQKEPKLIVANLHNIAHYGRYDDLFELLDTSVEKEMLAYIKSTIEQDLKSDDEVTLLGKWLPSLNTSSKLTRIKAGKIRRFLEIDSKQYRKILSTLRIKIDVVEKKMSSNQWKEINYEAVPSRAMMIYRKAFERHDEGFNTYVEKVENGEAKVNSGTLYPYDLMEKMDLRIGSYDSMLRNPEPILVEQWKALPNFIEGENNILVMADTSGSMNGRPMMTSVGLALYFAERNKGLFKDVFMTFSDNPEFIQLKGQTLPEKVRNIKSIVANTNLDKAFEKILMACANNELPQEQVPKALVVISDMQFDLMTSHNDKTVYEKYVDKFAEYGYTIPNIIYWNVNSSTDVFQTFSDVKGVQMYAGQSVSVFKAIINNIGKTPYQAMEDVLNSEEFDRIITRAD